MIKNLPKNIMKMIKNLPYLNEKMKMKMKIFIEKHYIGLIHGNH